MLVLRLLFALLVALASPSALPAQARPTQVDISLAPAEDAASQLRALEDAYTLLMDRFVHPVNSAALLKAGWDQLTREAGDRKAAPPGPGPRLVADRAADLEAMRQALTAYLAKPNLPDGLVAGHAVIRGMVRFVNEGHTYFLDPQQYMEYQSWSRGENRYVGIGVSVNTRGPEPRIGEVYENTPAAAAGLRNGDVLLEVGGQPAAGKSVDELGRLIRGPAGTTVQMVVRRPGEAEPLTFTIPRAEISLGFVSQRLIGDDVGYLLLRGFPEPSVVDAIERGVSTFQDQGVRGLVLDLRGNSGGRLDVGTNLLGHFVPSGASIFEEVDRSGRRRMHYTRSGATQYG
ncbi:MAG TPA: PDZ domain-containing protein, partial [Chloroflexota bacterium]|nr:PDZ domain-containing protein [Chloroflexota bacterium]